MSHASPVQDAIEWQKDVSLLGQPTMVANFLKVIVIAAGVMSALLVFMAFVTDGRGEILVSLELTGMCVGFVAILMLLIMIVFFRNRMSMAFRVDAAGARAGVIDRRARAGAKTALVVGALSGNPQLAGAGLIAVSSSSQSVAWSAVKKVRRSPRWRTIALANSWRTVLILYCEESNYEAVDRFVEGAVQAAPHLARPNPLPGLLLRSVLSIIASLPLFALPHPVQVDALAPLLALCFALTSVWLFPIFGWAVMGALCWVALEVIAAGAAPYTSIIAGDRVSQFDLLLSNDWAEIGVALAGAAYLVAQSLALLRGRFQSALAGDLSEGEPAAAKRKVAAKPGSLERPAPHFCADCGARLDAAGVCPTCGKRS